MQHVEEGTKVRIKSTFETHCGTLEEGSVGTIKQVVANYGPDADVEVTFDIGVVQVLVPFEAEAIEQDSDGVYRQSMVVPALEVHLKDQVLYVRDLKWTAVHSITLEVDIVAYRNESGNLIRVAPGIADVTVRRAV